MSFSKVLQNSFKVIYHNQTPIETYTLPVICFFKRSNPTLQLIFQNSEMFISFVMSLSRNWVKRAQSCISCIVVDRKIEISIWWKFEVWSLFLRLLSQKYCSFDSLGDVIDPKLGQKGPKLVFHVPMVIERWT